VVKKFLLIGILLLISLSLFSAEVVRYVDPDSVGTPDGLTWATAYLSLSLWEAGEGTNLVSDGDWHHVYCRASSGSADTTQVTINGFTTDSTHYIVVEAADGDQALKTGISTSRYRLALDPGNTGIILVEDNYVTIKGIQIVGTFSTHGHDIKITATNCKVDSCYLTGDLTGDHWNFGVEVGTGPDTIFNTIATGFNNTNTNAGFRTDTGTMYVYNSISYDCYAGVRNGSGTVVATNCAVFSSTGEDFNGTITVDYCASDDGTGTNSVAASGSDWANEFPDYATLDFTMINTGNAYHGGTTGPATSLYTTDMEGDTYYSTAYSIGVDEYVAAGGISIPVAMNHYRHLFNTIVFSLNFLMTIFVFRKMLYYKRKLLFYTDDNIKALADLNNYLEERKP